MKKAQGGRAQNGRIVTVLPAMPAMPWWFPFVVIGIAASGFLGFPLGIALLLASLVTLATARDLWQSTLVALLFSLTVATTRPEVIGFQLPFLLRFVLVSVLLFLTVVNHGFGLRSAPVIGRVQRLLLLFLMVASVGSLSSVYLTASVQGYLASAVTLAVAFVAANARWKHREVLMSDLAIIYRYLLAIVAIGLGTAAAAGFAGRAAGVHANPNTYAYMCVLAFGLDLGLRRTTPRATRAVITVALILGILASGSRGALFGLLLAVTYLLVRRGSRSHGRRVALVLLTGGTLLLAFPVTGPLDVRAVYERTFGEEEVDLSGRQLAWENMLRLSAERPFFGHGLRSTEGLVRDRFSTGTFESRLGGHSGYLTVLVETGWLGASLLFLAVGAALRRPLRNSEDESLWVASSSTVVAGLGHMTAESFVLGIGSPFPILFWSAVAVTALLSGNAATPQGRSPSAFGPRAARHRAALQITPRIHAGSDDVARTSPGSNW